MNEVICPANIGIKLFTISDTRQPEEDRSGEIMKEKIKNSQFTLSGHEILREEPNNIRRAVKTALKREEVRVVISSGGTGVGDRDRTIEELIPLIDKKLPAFSGLFQQLSYEQVGARCILSRAAAGRSGNDVIFMLPGSPEAVKLAMEKIILETLHHLLEIIEQ